MKHWKSLSWDCRALFLPIDGTVCVQEKYHVWYMEKLGYPSAHQPESHLSKRYHILHLIGKYLLYHFSCYAALDFTGNNGVDIKYWRMVPLKVKTLQHFTKCSLKYCSLLCYVLVFGSSGPLYYYYYCSDWLPAAGLSIVIGGVGDTLKKGMFSMSPAAARAVIHWPFWNFQDDIRPNNRKVTQSTNNPTAAFTSFFPPPRCWPCLLWLYVHPPSPSRATGVQSSYSSSSGHD